MVGAMLLFWLVGCGSFGLQSIELVEAEGHLGIAPTGTVDFGKEIVNQGSSLQTVTLNVQGDVGVRVVSVWVESSAGAFSIDGVPPIPKRLEPGQQVGVKIRFEPGGKGDFSGTFVAETAGGNIVERELIGQGCADRDDNGRCD